MLTKHQQRILREILADRRETLRHGLDDEEAEEIAASHDEWAGVSGNVGDQATADLTTDIRIAMTEQHVEELRGIDAALARIADGTFGTCVDCDLAVDFQRLLACPAARRCLQCQQLHEATLSSSAS